MVLGTRTVKSAVLTHNLGLFQALNSPTCPARASPNARRSDHPTLGLVSERVTCIYYLVPGPWTAVDEVLAVLGAADVHASPIDDAPAKAGGARVELVSEPGGFGHAMARGRDGALPKEVVAAAEACTHAALLEFAFPLNHDPARVAKAGRALQGNGGVAIRNEASGGASTWAPWLAGLETENGEGLVATSVTYVGDEDGWTSTCGMHAFDLPDAQIRTNDPVEALEWLDIFLNYMLLEQPTLATGHTFSPRADTPHRRIERWPDALHSPEDGRHNPFGLWRLVPDDEDALEPMNPALHVTPSLIALLHAAEKQKQRPLDRQEVQTMVDAAPTIALPPAQVHALELARGYADIEPRRAWDQWQLVRRWF